MVEHSAVNRVVVGSSPTRGAVRMGVRYSRIHSYFYKNIRLHGQAVKTPPFHGGIRGSNPLGVISRIKRKWTFGDSNPGPTGYEPVALTN